VRTAVTASRGRRAFRVLLLTIGVLAAAHLLFLAWFGTRLVGLRTHNPDVTSIMRSRGDRNPLDPGGFLPLAEIPPFVRDLVVLAEDSRFYLHHGIDFTSIRLALRVNAEKGRVVYGGSTISQQLARSLFLWTGRSYVRKYLEMLIAVEEEILLGKDRILELYLDCAEWGPGIYGIQRAARFYYGKDVPDLTRDQLIRLVTILPSPRRAVPGSVDTDPLLAARYQAIVEDSKRLENSPPVFSSTLEEVP
jgi:monofunctional biosynthetic peptidoglycan transglycosylase